MLNGTWVEKPVCESTYPVFTGTFLNWSDIKNITGGNIIP
jgi:hypothetical protein